MICGTRARLRAWIRNSAQRPLKPRPEPEQRSARPDQSAIEDPSCRPDAATNQTCLDRGHILRCMDLLWTKALHVARGLLDNVMPFLSRTGLSQGARQGSMVL